MAGVLAILMALAAQQEPRLRDGYALVTEARRLASQPRAPARTIGELAVIPLEWSDLRHPRGIEAEHFHAMFFSRGEYFQQNRARQQAAGSVADWLAQNSADRVSLTGRVHQWVTSELAWADVRSGVDAERLLVRTLDRAAERDGTERLQRAAHVVVFAMGSRRDLAPDHPLRPRTLDVAWEGRARRVTIVDSGLEEGTPVTSLAGVGTVVRELVRGLGLGEHASGWCAMDDGSGSPLSGHGVSDHRRPHLCAPCKARLGWLQPARLDPRDPQKIALRPVERRPDAACLPVAAGEVLILENRQRIGFDRGLPAGGLLVWHVRGADQRLVEAHGLPFRDASWKFPSWVPFPTPLATSFEESGVAVTNIAVDEAGVAYFEVGAGVPNREIEFERERYSVVPGVPRVATAPVHLAVVLVEFDDVRATAEARAFRDFFFELGPRVPVRDARGEFGRLTSGLSDYVWQSSGGAAAVCGKVSDGWLRLPRKRADYARLSPADRQREFFNPIVEVGGRADAVVAVIAGPAGPQGFAPQSATVQVGAGAVPVLVLPEGSTDVAQPAALVLRLAGLAGRSATVAGDKIWCAAGATSATRERILPGPTLLCSWCRERAGWVKPADVASGRYALPPLAVGGRAARIAIRDGECYLLENRQRWEFDRALPREGLVVWHVTPADARCTSCVDGGILDVWLVHDPPAGGAGAVSRYQPWLSLPKKGLSLRLSDGRTEIAGIKADARSTIYFELEAPDR